MASSTPISPATTAALNTMPVLALPVYWIFGHSDFEGYFVARPDTRKAISPTVKRLVDDLEGIQVPRYTDGFTHQKVMLVDDDFATVGTANFDNRSFRLNFEVTAAVFDRDFTSQVATMLEADFERSKPATAANMTDANFFFRLKARAARLLAPIQ